MEKLIELANAGVEVTIYGPYLFRKEWRVTATKSDTEGTELKIVTEHEVLLRAIEDAYDKWIRSTTNGLPNLSLRQIEHNAS
jgi:short-subunit dehydrogenase